MRSSAGDRRQRVDAFGEEERRGRPAGGSRRRARATGSPRPRRARCRSGAGSRRRGSGCRALPPPPRRASGRRAAASDPGRAAGGPRSAPPCTAAAGGPERSVTQRPRSSTPPSPANVPATEVSRKRTTEVGRGTPTAASPSRARASSREYGSSLSPGRPNQTARTERWPSGIRSIAWATARSCATSAPTLPPRTTDAPAAIPSTTRTTGALRRPSRAPTSRSG